MSHFNSLGVFGCCRPVVCDTACTETKFVFLLTERGEFCNRRVSRTVIWPIGERVTLGIFRQNIVVQLRQSLCFSCGNVRFVGVVVQRRKFIVIFSVKHCIDRLPRNHQCNGVFFTEVKTSLLRVIKRVIIGCCRHTVQYHGIVAAGVKGNTVFF